MPRYFFNVRDRVSPPDEIGTELLDWQQARIEAVRLAGRILHDQAASIALSDDWHMEVTDERHLVLFRLDFITQEAPALHRFRGI